MLTDDEMSLIRAEELFRLEVRRELEAAKPRPTGAQKLWSWLNSAFGLWLLSSVVLTGLTTAYAHYREASEQAHKKEEMQRSLLIEIAGRMDQATRVLDKFQKDIAQGTFGAPSDIYSTMVSYLDNSFLYDPNNRQDLSILSRLSEAQLPIAGLRVRQTDKARQMAADQAIEDYYHFRDLASAARQLQ